MRIKSYFANSVTEAINLARTELGPDAMIIASNRAPADSERLGKYEVVFGLADMPTGTESQPEAPPPPEGLEKLRERMEELRKSVSKKREQASAARIVPAGAKVTASLRRAGFPEGVAEEFARSLQIRARDGAPPSAADALGSAIRKHVRVNCRLGSGGPGRSIVALVGPPGVGKTSTLVKLAVTYGLATGRPTRFISTDTRRLGGSELLSRYARWMGLKVELPTTIDALEQALSAADRNELLLIDTAGYSRANIASALPLAALLSKRAGIDVHLVLPAYASAHALACFAEQFKTFLPSKLLFTSADTAETLAPALALASSAEMPVSFLGTGDQVPEDIEEAAVPSLAARLLPALLEAAAPAA